MYNINNIRQTFWLVLRNRNIMFRGETKEEKQEYL